MDLIKVMTDEWEARQWISAIGIVVFSVIGTIIQLVYIYKLWKRRKKVADHKYFIVRGQALFITHCVMNFYWSSLHPIIVGMFFIFHPHQLFILITLWCYGLFQLNMVVIIYMIRCWLLYFNFNWYALQFEKMWKSHLLKNHYKLGWFERHKRFGNVSFLSVLGLIFMIILCGSCIPYAYISQLNIWWYLLAATGIIVMNIMSILVVLKLHSLKSVDNFGMRHELTIFVLVILLLTTLSIIPFFLIKDNWIRLWICNTPISTAALFVNTFQLSNLLKQILKMEKIEKGQNNNTEENVVRNISLSVNNKQINEYKFEQLKLIDILSNKTGINEFARFLIGEFSLEHLLFLIEVSQFKFQFAIQKKSLIKHRTTSKSQTLTTSAEENTNNIINDDKNLKESSFRINIPTEDDIKCITNDNDGDDDYNDEYEYRFHLSSNIPLCATIIDYPDEPIKQANTIRDKFIANPSSQLGINISGSKRRQIMQIDLQSITNTELKNIFDDIYNEVFRLIELDSFQRYVDMATTSKTVYKLLKKILKKKRKTRQRAKSRQRAHSKKEKQSQQQHEKNKQRKGARDRISSASPSLKPIVAMTPMFKSISLSGSAQKSASLTFNIDDVSDMSDMEEENSVNPSISKTPSPSNMNIDGIPHSKDFDEEQLADPFNNLYRSDSASTSQRNIKTMEHGVHNVLHPISKHSCKCFGC